MEQTSAKVGTAKVGTSKAGVLVEAAGGLPQHSEENATRVNPWRRRTVVTTTWSAR